MTSFGKIQRSIKRRLRTLFSSPTSHNQTAVTLLKVTNQNPPEIDGLHSVLDMRPGPMPSYSITVQGWVVSTGSPVVSVSVIMNGQEVYTQAPWVKRQELAEHFPNIPTANKSGFLMNVSLLEAPPTEYAEIDVVVTLEDGRRATIGHVKAQLHPLRVAYKPTIQPLIVRYMGRTGSTWMMRLLSEHPDIVVYPQYPYEIGAFRYWMHLFRVTAPAGNLDRFFLDNFLDNPYQIGANPVNSPNIIQDPELAHWIGIDYANNLAALCMRSTDQFYQHVARMVGRKRPVYFAEKIPRDRSIGSTYWLYPKVREITLLRDPRDIFASVYSFNAKRGYIGFQVDRSADEIEYMHDLRNRFQGNIDFLKQQNALMVRYEDLILKPEETLTRVFTYLGLDASPQRIADVMARASVESTEMTNHRTTESPESSIGRWRHDLTPEMRAAATEIFHDQLIAMGYDLT